jgi:Tol biopolymer transport system component/imidazolonepropionase-like amidohydrolase
MTGRQLRRPVLKSLFSGLASLLAASIISACASGAPGAGGFTAGVSGRPPTPIARTGQTLPLAPAREIRFETTTGTERALDVSPDGTCLVFDMLGDIYSMPSSGGRAEPLTRGMALDTQPVFSPDGRRILFLSDRSGAENLWIMDVDGSHPRQISYYDDDPTFVSPEWSPDGKSILVTRFWPDRNAYELWQFRPQSGDMGRVLRAAPAGDEPGANSLDATFAPDGQSVYVASLEDDSPAFDELSSWKIMQLDLRGGELPVPAGGAGASSGIPAFRPMVSPDGATLAFIERREGVTRLMTSSLLGNSGPRLVAELDPDNLEAALTHGAAPRFDFAPDSRSIYVNRKGLIQSINLASGEVTDIPFTALVDQTLGKLVRTQAAIDEGPVRARLIQSPALSVDGQTIAFSSLGRLFTQHLGEKAASLSLLPDGEFGYHPAWSADGASIAYVSWSNSGGGQVRIASVDGGSSHPVTRDAAFYTHPVFTPDGQALVAVRSSAQARRETYMEYGQLRDAELVLVPLDGGAIKVLANDNIGGTPHFRGVPDEVLINFTDGIHAISLDGEQNTRVTQAVGPNWYFAYGPAPADDLRVSPDGNWALAQIAQQLHLYQIDPAKGPVVDLSDPQVSHVRLTRIGVDYFGWSPDGKGLYWTVGSTVCRLQLSAVAWSAGDSEQSCDRDDVVVEMARDRPQGSILLSGAAVIAMSDRADPGRLMPSTDVLIDQNRIAAIGPSGSLAVPENALTVDVTGKYIIPGLIDAHYHVADIRRDVLDFDAWGLKAGLAFGLTTLFDPSSLTIDMLAYEDLVDTGDVTGSRLFTTGPAIFDYNDFRSKDDVRAVLSRYKDAYRLSNLKQYRAGNRRVRQWISEVADEVGLTVTTEGALSYKLDLTQILDGYSGVEHAVPPPVHYKDLTELFARSGTTSTLTLMITHGGLPADKVFIARENPIANEKYARFAPEWYRQSRFEGVGADPASAYLYTRVAASAADMLRAGGTVGVGAHGDVPGFGTHWEMQAYVEGGWTPAEALWAATMGSATVIARDQSLGSVEPGKLADLVVLDANPLDDIRRTQAIRYVMKNGRLYDDETLEEITGPSKP